MKQIKHYFKSCSCSLLRTIVYIDQPHDVSNHEKKLVDNVVASLWYREKLPAIQGNWPGSTPYLAANIMNETVTFEGLF